MVSVKPPLSLSPLGTMLADSLTRIDTYETNLLAQREKETVHIPTVGSKLSTAYEQLRNASEYAEDNLLRQRAIRRYLKRVLSFHEKINTAPLAEELITELTQAEYIPNNFITPSEIKQIGDHIKRYYNAYWQYAKIEPNSHKRLKFQEWMLDVLSVRCEQVIQSNIRQLSFSHLAFTYLQPKLDIARLVRPGESIDPHDYSIVLYIAIQRAILKFDAASIRAALLDSYRQDIGLIHNFEAFNTKIDALFDSNTVAYTSRIVSRNGAALRMLYSGFYVPDAPISLQSLKSEDSLDYALRQHIEKEYAELNSRLDKGILRSIAFLLITKSLIGLGVEVPYDLMVEGQILWVPLIINLFFPAAFIALSRLTLSTPTSRNTDAIIAQIQAMLYGGSDDTHPIRIPRSTPSLAFNIVYAVMFAAIFAGLSYVLYRLHFNIVQGVIFFIFLSTASFLAFRLSNQIREIEAVHLSQGSLALLRDILYMPFIYVGQQISYRYSRINIVATVLDILIELPLKTVLRLARQWTVFLNSKKDELL